MPLVVLTRRLPSSTDLDHGWVPLAWVAIYLVISSELLFLLFLSFLTDLCIYQVCGNFAKDTPFHQIEAKIGFEQVDLSRAQYVLAFERYAPFLIKF